MSKLKSVFLVLVISIVAIGIIVGLMLVGSPVKQHLRKIDERRVKDLQDITVAINYYWTHHKKLPISLSVLSKEPGISINPSDPESKQSYEYLINNQKNYQLCANFAFATEQDSYPYKEFWTHGAGRQCYQLKAKEVTP